MASPLPLPRDLTIPEPGSTTYLTLHPNVMTLAEAVIHEFSHNKLHALFELDPVIENDSAARFASPVRPDPRPLKVEVETHRHAAFVAIASEEQGREIPFRFAVPASTPTSLSLPRGTLFRVFEVRLAVPGAGSVVHRTPVTIAAFEGPAGAASAEPPPIGASRWHALWDKVGSSAGLTIDRKRLLLTTLAQALAEAFDKIPTPAGMEPFLRAWRRFAESADAELTVGNMAITGGEFEGAISEIRTELEARTPVATTLDLVIDPPLDAVVDLASDSAIQRAPAAVREILGVIAALSRPWLAGPYAPPRAPVPQLREALFSIRLPAVVEDPAALRELMTALLSLAAALRGERRAGPYR